MPRVRRSGRQAWVLAAAIALTAACGAASTVRGAGSDAAPASDSPRAVLMAQPIVFVPSAIDYTGKTDVTNALQSFIDNVNDGSLVRFHKNGRYRVEGTIFVTNKTNLTFDGQNATIFATTTGTLERSQWWITEGGGLVFRNFIVQDLVILFVSQDFVFQFTVRMHSSAPLVGAPLSGCFLLWWRGRTYPPPLQRHEAVAPR